MNFADWWKAHQSGAAPHMAPHVLELCEQLCGLAWRAAETQARDVEWAKQTRWILELEDDVRKAIKKEISF